MKTVTEIFATNPKLLEAPEVKEFIEQFRIQFQTNLRKHNSYWDSVTTLTMNSEFFVINGIPLKEVVEKIHNLSFNNTF